MSAGRPWAEALPALGRLRPHATVAIGGVSGSRKPMSLLRALVGAGARDLRVVSFLGGVDVEFLLASEVVAELHTAGVSLDAAGLAPLYRRARQEGRPAVIEWSEGSLHAALEAAALGLPSLAATTSPRSDVVRTNPHLKVFSDPFSGGQVVAAQALVPDLALLHAPFADRAGNVTIAGDPGVDGMLARASRRVVVSVSQVVERPPVTATLSRIWVDALVHQPGGSWPTECLPTDPAESSVFRSWAADPGSAHSLVLDVDSHG